MNVETNHNPLILIFDLDETLFLVQEKPSCQTTPLSKSAENLLSTSAEGIKTKFPLKGTIPNVAKAEKITAIARKTMKEIFQKIHEINLTAQEKGLNPPIYVKIMTSATYDEKYVKRLLDEFYFENDNPFRTGAFRIEYFNNNNLENTPPIDAPADRPTKKGTMDQRKALLIEKKFKEWVGCIPNLKKEDVVLIDNADMNTVAVETCGFRAIHYPTTLEDRLSTINYTEEAPKAFDQLLTLISKAALASK